MDIERPARLGLICDYAEERWPSMDLAGEMIRAHLRAEHAGAFEVVPLRPPYRHRAGRWPWPGRLAGAARNADRLLNRFLDYPAALRRAARRGGCDVYHVVDHSYAQVVHALPAERTVVTCYDLDTFRCLLEPAREPRPRWFRAMAGRILAGMRRAALVACASEATRRAILAHGLLPDDRLRVVHLGIHAECAPEPDPPADAEAARHLGPPGPAELLHVGSNIARKRIDVLLRVFAEARRAEPGARLVKVGGALTPEQERLARDLGVRDAVAVVPVLDPTARDDRRTMAAYYRRAALVLLPSDAEGFGLPVAEALACGAAVLASDLPVLREVGGDAAEYRRVADVPAWAEAVAHLLRERREDPAAWAARRAAGIARSGRFRWSAHVDQLTGLYREVLGRAPAPVPAPAR